MRDTSFVESVMRTASKAGLPILIVLVRGKLSHVDAYADSTDLFFDVSFASELLISKEAISFEAGTLQEFAEVLRKGLHQIAEALLPEKGISSDVTTRMDSIASSCVADVATEKGFFDSGWHQEGKGLDHNYEIIEREGQTAFILIIIFNFLKLGKSYAFSNY